MSPTVVAIVLTGAGALAAFLWKRKVQRRARRGTSEPIGSLTREPTLAQRARVRRATAEKLKQQAEKLKQQRAEKKRRLAAGRVCALCTAVVWHDEPQYLMHGGEICPACLRHRGPYFPVDTPAGPRWA